MRAALLPSLFFLAIGLQAQTTFAPEGATWVYPVWNPWTSSSAPITFTASGDTTIQDITCQRIDVVVVPCTYFDLQDSYPRMFTYTSGDSVFWFDRVSETFRLLAPFDAQPGSSWQLDLPSSLIDPDVSDIARFTVQSVGTIDVDGQTLRRLHVAQEFITDNGYLRFRSATATFTERLGHELFMLPWLMSCADAPTPMGLACYTDADMHWSDPDLPCGISTSMADEAFETELSVTPTLLEAGGAIRLSATLPQAVHARWQVTDVLGRTLQEEPFLGRSTTWTLERSGTFLILLRTDRGEVLTQRVVVQ